MAKVKINSLPPGVTIKDGKIVTSMQQGGTTTGDQFDFGLTTTVKYPEKENNTKEEELNEKIASLQSQLEASRQKQTVLEQKIIQLMSFIKRIFPFFK